MSAYDEHDDDAFDWRDASPEERVPPADCTSCPVGFLRDLSREAQPEVTLHLLAAARELLLAMETVVRAADGRMEHLHLGGERRRNRLEGASRRRSGRHRPLRHHGRGPDGGVQRS